MQAAVRRSQSGFTLIEIMVVIAIIGVLMGILFPAVQTARHAANQARAAETLREITDAQAAFKAEDGDGDGAPDYAGSVQELVEAGLLDGFDGNVKQGYQFPMLAGAAVSVPGGPPYYWWTGLGTPLLPMPEQDQSLYGDETGVIRRLPCPPGQKPILVDGKVVCVPAPVPGPMGGAMAVASMDAANLVSGGNALPAVQDALAGLVEPILGEFDADHDLHISYEEVLAADILAMAQSIAGSRPAPGEAVAGDDLLAFILAGFQDRLKADAALHPTETDIPKVAIAGLLGHPEAVVELVSPSLPFGSLSVLEGLIEGLDPDPAAGQMSAPDEATNAQRKARMLDSVRKMPALLRFQRLEHLTSGLLLLRARTDGVPAVDDWVIGESAARITAQIDKTLGLIGSAPLRTVIASAAGGGE